MRLAVIALILASACTQDETISGFADVGSIWQLSELDGEAWNARTTLEISEKGRITGQAPCNSYFSVQTAPYPWFELGPIGASKMACRELDAESKYFAALGAMTIAEVNGPVLILSNEEGGEMVFRRVN